MSSSKPRIPLVRPEDFNAAQAALAGDWSQYSFTQLMVQNLDLYRAFMPLGEKLVRGSDLPPRDREILILRTLALCGERYETEHHVHIARSIGMTDAEIEAARNGGHGLAPSDSVIVSAAEELMRDHDLSQELWDVLAARYTQPQMIEFVFVAGAFNMMSVVTKTLRVPSDPSPG